MNRSAYYHEMRALALEKRAFHGVKTESLDLRVIHRIYKAEGIRIDPWEIRTSRIRAAYFCDSNDYSVMVNKKLPREPKLFSLVHELKHHYVDQGKIRNGEIKCGDYNANEAIEIAAEIFAAEFIYPEAEMRTLTDDLGISAECCTAAKIVEFKRVCSAPVSYTFLVKRFSWFGFCNQGSYKNVQFQKLEEKLYGLPIYKQPWFKRHRERMKIRSRT